MEQSAAIALLSVKGGIKQQRKRRRPFELPKAKSKKSEGADHQVVEKRSKSKDPNIKKQASKSRDQIKRVNRKRSRLSHQLLLEDSPPKAAPPTKGKKAHSRKPTTKEPTKEEWEEARTDRAKSALSNWYRRLNELYEYKATHGHSEYSLLKFRSVSQDLLFTLSLFISLANVPQRFDENPQLGVW